MAALIVEKTSSGCEYKVKDMSQADFDRLELDLVEVKMPGLMACQNEFGPSQPFKDARITGSLHMTIQTAVLIETLTALDAEVHWCSCNIFSTQDHVTAAIVRDSAAVFAWKGETLQILTAIYFTKSSSSLRSHPVVAAISSLILTATDFTPSSLSLRSHSVVATDLIPFLKLKNL